MKGRQIWSNTLRRLWWSGHRRAAWGQAAAPPLHAGVLRGLARLVLRGEKVEAGAAIWCCSGAPGRKRKTGRQPRFLSPGPDPSGLPLGRREPGAWGPGGGACRAPTCTWGRGSRAGRGGENSARNQAVPAYVISRQSDVQHGAFTSECLIRRDQSFQNYRSRSQVSSSCTYLTHPWLFLAFPLEWKCASCFRLTALSLVIESKKWLCSTAVSFSRLWWARLLSVPEFAYCRDHAFQVLATLYLPLVPSS